MLKIINKLPASQFLVAFFLMTFVTACKSESTGPAVISDEKTSAELPSISESDTTNMKELDVKNPDSANEDVVQNQNTIEQPKSKGPIIPPAKQTSPKQDGTNVKMGNFDQKGVEVVEMTEKDLPSNLKTGSTVTAVKVGGDETPKIEVEKKEIKIAEVAADIHKHEILQTLLSAHVSSTGVVDYKVLKGKESQLDEYLKLLSDNPPASAWSRDQKLAYWINAYNAFTIKAVLKNYPLKSIKDISGGKIWDVKWINLGSSKYSLNDIENTIVRPQFKDPRIHFALNCGAKSCPPLDNSVYLPGNVQTLLEQNAKAFVRNKAMNDISENKVVVSSIFDWYGVDFGNVIDFLSKYSGVAISKNAKIEFKPYDWTLNGK